MKPSGCNMKSIRQPDKHSPRNVHAYYVNAVTSLKILKHYKLMIVCTPCCVPYYIDVNLDVVFWTIRPTMKRRDSSVGIAPGYRSEGRGSPAPTPRAQRPDKALGPTRPRFLWVPATISPRIQRPGCEADNSPPSNA
jgi:hypothetical protein